MKTIRIHPLETPDSCTGCGACAAVCKASCITMQSDGEGFLHPRIDTCICTNCDLCRRVCPANQDLPFGAGGRGEGPLQVLAAWHLDENIRRESSSGGVFTALAEDTLSRGGAVVGAAFDDQLVVRHIIVEEATELYRLRGSKYVQSQLSTVLYCGIRDLLQQGRSVLFTGTPCQVAGLQTFLHKPYESLFCVDLTCHGTPSPLFWARYVQHIKVMGNKLSYVSFRDKTTGWKNFGVRLYLQNGLTKHLAMTTDPYMVSFLRNYSLRPSCYACQFTSTKRSGDLTIADFWGVALKYPEFDREDKGTSLVLVNTEKGKRLLLACGSRLFTGVADLDTAIAGNHVLARPSHRPQERKTFYADLEALSFNSLVRKYRLHGPSLTRRLLRAIKRRLMCR